MKAKGLENDLLLCMIFVILTDLSGAHERSEEPDECPDIVKTRITNLGEPETKIKTNRVKLIETTEPSQGENFLFVKEAVKHNRLVWLVYQDKHHIIDCNITTNVHDLVKFDKKFSSYGRDWISNKFHENGKAAEHSSDIDFRGLLRQCRLFKRQIRAIRIEHHHEEHNNKRSKSNQHNKDGTKAGTRPKRSAFSMIYPGTNWCGAGDRASGGYEDLGEHAATDSCCREHDHCPYYISGFKTKYNFWNYRFHTLSHCNCEEKFLSCLKSAETSIANRIGYIYFNYIGTKCFNLKPKKICKRRSWWGRCTKYRSVYTAQLIDSNLHY